MVTPNSVAVKPYLLLSFFFVFAIYVSIKIYNRNILKLATYIVTGCAVLRSEYEPARDGQHDVVEELTHLLVTVSTM